MWAVLPLLALACWRVAAGRGGAAVHPTQPPRAHDATTTGTRGVWREPAAWLLTAYLGLTSLLFYTTAAWLPAILEAGGAAPTAAGMVTALAGFIAVPASFLAPLAARRPPTTHVLAVLAPTPIAVGLLVIAAAPEARVLGAALIGVGQGASVGIADTLIIVSAGTTQHAAALSSMSQTVGVSLAALGPFAFAATQEALGSWAGAAALLALVPVVQALLALARRTPGRTGRSRARRAQDGNRWRDGAPPQ